MPPTKVRIERIQANKLRRSTFLKRKLGLIKKAIELTVLCDCDCAIILRSTRPAETLSSRDGPMVMYCNREINTMIQECAEDIANTPQITNAEYERLSKDQEAIDQVANAANSASRDAGDDTPTKRHHMTNSQASDDELSLMETIKALETQINMFRQTQSFNNTSSSSGGFNATIPRSGPQHTPLGANLYMHPSTSMYCPPPAATSEGTAVSNFEPHQASEQCLDKWLYQSSNLQGESDIYARFRTIEDPGSSFSHPDRDFKNSNVMHMPQACLQQLQPSSVPGFPPRHSSQLTMEGSARYPIVNQPMMWSHSTGDIPYRSEHAETAASHGESTPASLLSLPRDRDRWTRHPQAGFAMPSIADGFEDSFAGSGSTTWGAPSLEQVLPDSKRIKRKAEG